MAAESTPSYITLRVADLMSTPVLSAPRSATLREAAARMSRARCSVILVTHRNQPLGLITENGIAQHFRIGTPQRTRVGEALSCPVSTIAASASAIEALRRMQRIGSMALLAMGKNGRPSGIVTETDLRKALGTEILRSLRGLRDALDGVLPEVATSDSLGHAVQVMADTGMDYVVVLDSRRRPLSLVTSRDITRAYALGIDPESAVSTLMGRRIRTVRESASLIEVTEIMNRGRSRHVVAVDARGAVAGVVSQHRLLSRIPLDVIADLQQGQAELVRQRDDASRSLAALLEAMDLVYWSFSLSDRAWSCGNGLWPILGYPRGRDPADMKRFFSLIHPGDRAAVKSLPDRALSETGRKVDVEFRIRRKDERWAWMLMRGKTLPGEETVGGVVVDVTERKYGDLILQTEQRLMQAVDDATSMESLQSGLLDALRDLPELDGGGVYWRQPDGGFRLVSHSGLSRRFVSKVGDIPAGSPRAASVNTGVLLVASVEPTAQTNAPGDMLSGEVAAEGITALAVLPILVDGKALACVNLASRQARSWHPRVESGFERLARMIGQGFKRLAAQQERIEQKRSLEALVESMSDYVFVTDTRGVILHYNGAVRSGLGYGDSLLGQPLARVHPPGAAARAAALIRPVVRRGGGSFTLPMIHADGSSFTADIRVGMGEWLGKPAMFGIARDVTERERQAAALVSQRTFSDLLIESLPGVFLLLDSEGRIQRWNTRTEEATGLTADSLRGRLADELVSQGDRPAFASALQKAIATGDSTVDGRLTDRKRPPVLHRFRMRRTLIEGVTYMISFGVSIAAEAEARAQLHEERELLRTLVRTMPDLVWLKDAQGRYVICNEEAARFFRSPPAEVVGRTDRELFPESEAEEFASSDRVAAGSDGPMRFEQKVRGTTVSETIQLETIKVAMRDRHGRLTGILGVARDVTAARRTQFELRERGKELQCLYNVFQLTESHDLPPGSILSAVAPEIPPAMQFPELVAARISFGEHDFRTEGFKLADSAMCLTITFSADGTEGRIEVAYLRPPPADTQNVFLPEESKMLESVARRLTGVFTRQRLTQRQRSREKLFASIVEQAPEWMGLVDAHDGAMIEFNEAAYRNLGYSREEFARLRVADVEADQDPDFVIENLARLRASGGGVFESRHRRKDGDIRNVRVSVRYIEDAGRAMFATVVSDLTEQKRALLELVDREEELNRAQSVARIGSWSMDIDSGLMKMSAEARRITGLGDGGPPHIDRFMAIVHPEDRVSLQQKWLAALKGAEYEVDHRIIVGDSELWVRQHAKLEFGPSGRAVSAVGTLQDITAHHRAEEDLRLLSLAVEQSSAGIVITDVNARTLYVNRGFEQNSGYSREDVLGRNPRLLKSGQTPDSVYRTMWQTLTAGEPWRGEFINRRRDGTVHLVFAVIAPVRSADGRITHYVGVEEDITQRKQIESELALHRSHLMELVEQRTTDLAKATMRAEVANQAKSEFLANMSHEIRTPMNAIIGLAHLIGRDPLSAPQKDKLGKLMASARHLLNVISDILDITKIESGKMIIEQVDFDLLEMVENACEVIAGRAVEKGLQIYREIDPAVHGRCHGDPVRLTQVLLNLGSNAVKFTERGSVTCRIFPLSVADRRRWVRFEVRDTGIGLTPDQTGRLFRPFEQADASTTRRFGGTGLGLSISKSLVEMMEGRIGVESESGRGSLFWFEIPLDPAPGERPAPAPAGQGVVAGRISTGRETPARILVVEDDPLNQQIAGELLTNEGYEVEVACNGAQALERAAAHAYDLILMDVNMPVMDGLEATRRLRARPEYARTPVIGLSASVFNEDRKRCLDAGMSAFVPKPIDPDFLLAELDRWVPRPANRPVSPDSSTALPDRLDDIPDLDTAAGLRSVGGRVESYLRLLRDYISRRSGTTQRIGAALARGDTAEALMESHALKGAAGAIGAVGVSRHAARLEARLRSAESASVLEADAGLLDSANNSLVGLIASALEKQTGKEPESAPVDWSVTLDLLENQLDSDDSAALVTLDRIEPGLRAVLGEPAATEVTRHVRNFAFPEALAALRSARSREDLGPA